MLKTILSAEGLLHHSPRDQSTEGVAIECGRDSVVHLGFEAECVSPRAVAMARAFARAANSDEIVVAGDGWNERAMPVDAFEAHMSGLLAGLTRTSHRCYQWDVTDDAPNTHTEVLQSLRTWFLSDGSIRPEDALSYLRSRDEAVRFAHFVADDQGDFVLSDLSMRLEERSLGWFATARGLPFRSFPDPAYSHWTRETYREVLEQDTPTLHYVTIDLALRHDQRYVQDYHRLVLPFEQRQGRVASVVVVMRDLQFAQLPLTLDCTTDTTKIIN